MNKRDIKRFQNILEKRVLSIKEDLKNTRQAIRQLDKNRCFYKVLLTSCWADYGEKSVTYTGKVGDSLKKVAKEAEEEFKRVNNRSDVQAFRTAVLVFENGEYIAVEYPEKK